MKALILAGGFGTRLKDVVRDLPKPLAPVLGKPFLEHQIRQLKEQGITEIILAVHHMSDKIKSYFANGLRLGIEITYSEEDKPLGTAGAIKKAQKYLNDTFIVLNGDTYSSIDINKMLEFHKSKKSNFTIALTKENDTINYGNVLMAGDKIVEFDEKSKNNSSLINCGAYIFEPKIFDYIEEDKSVSLEREIFDKLSKEGELYGFIHEGYFADIGRPESYKKFKDDALHSIFLKKNNTLREAMQKMNKLGMDIVLIVDEQKKLLGVITGRVIERFLLRGGNLESLLEEVMVKDPIVGKIDDDPSKIQEIFRAGVDRLPITDSFGVIRGLEFRKEKINAENFPLVRGRAPLRISFGGGGTDTPYFFEKYGGSVINATIDKYCYASILKRADSKIVINSDLGEETILDKNKLEYDGKYDIIKAVFNVLKPDFGFELYLYNDVKPGRGLGSSATLAVLLIKMISYLQNVEYDDYKIAELAHRVETEELKIKGGWQDQYAAITGGFSFMEFTPAKTIIYPLRLKEEFIQELNQHLLLCYVGQAHYSGEIHENQQATFVRNEEEIVKNLKEIKDLSVKIKDCLLTNEVEKIGELLHESWENKKKISDKISNPRIDLLYSIGLKNGAIGGKLLGAGAGGYILFLHSPKKRNQLKFALEKIGAEVMNFNFEFGGTRIWQVKDRI